MSDKIYYAVTKGIYSDYHIVTITEDKNKAEKIAKMLDGDYSPAQVEKFIEKEIISIPVWNVWFKKDYGPLFYADVSGYDDDCECRVYENNRKEISVFCQADSKESAIKIASDMRAKYLAEHLEL